MLPRRWRNRRKLFVPAQGRLVVCLDAHAPAVHLAAQELGLGVPQLRRLQKVRQRRLMITKELSVDNFPPPEYNGFRVNANTRRGECHAEGIYVEAPLPAGLPEQAEPPEACGPRARLQEVRQRRLMVPRPVGVPSGGEKRFRLIPAGKFLSGCPG